MFAYLREEVTIVTYLQHFVETAIQLDDAAANQRRLAAAERPRMYEKTVERSPENSGGLTVGAEEPRAAVDEQRLRMFDQPS